eukprot:gene8352-biopygen7617
MAPLARRSRLASAQGVTCIDCGVGGGAWQSNLGKRGGGISTGDVGGAARCGNGGKERIAAPQAPPDGRPKADQSARRNYDLVGQTPDAGCSLVPKTRAGSPAKAEPGQDGLPSPGKHRDIYTCGENAAPQAPRDPAEIRFRIRISDLERRQRQSGGLRNVWMASLWEKCVQSCECQKFEWNGRFKPQYFSFPDKSVTVSKGEQQRITKRSKV